MKTAVIYARYSSSNQTEQSIEGQVHVCQDFAKRNDIIIVDSYIDRAISGTTDEREAFQRMLKDSNNKKWNYVLVYKLDRFARNKYEAAIHRKHLKDNGIKLLSAMENIPETPEGVLLESLLEGMNQYFSEELAQKVSRGLHESRMKGHCIGSVGFGYTKDNQTKMLSINEEEAEILKYMFNEYLKGKPILKIAKSLNEKGITNKGKKFIPETIRDMLKREIYTGVLHINGKEYTKIYPRIIDIDLFQKVNDLLNKNRYGCRKPNHQIFRLKDKIFCACCNKKMYPVSTISPAGNSLRNYVCIEKHTIHIKSINKDFIESCVNKVLVSLFTTKENLDFFVNVLYEKIQKRASSKNTLTLMKSELEKTNIAIRNIMSAIEKGIITNTTKSRLEELELQQKDLQDKIIIEESKQVTETSKEELYQFFKYEFKEHSKQLIETFVKFVKVYTNKIEISLNYTKTQNDIESTILHKVFTETYTTTRTYKGGTTRTKSQIFDIYLTI